MAISYNSPILADMKNFYYNSSNNVRSGVGGGGGGGGGGNGSNFWRRHIFLLNFFDANVCIVIHILLNCVRSGSVANTAALVQVMVWCLVGTMALPKPILNTMYDTIFVGSDPN